MGSRGRGACGGSFLSAGFSAQGKSRAASDARVYIRTEVRLRSPTSSSVRAPEFALPRQGLSGAAAGRRQRLGSLCRFEGRKDGPPRGCFGCLYTVQCGGALALGTVLPSQRFKFDVGGKKGGGVKALLPRADCGLGLRGPSGAVALAFARVHRGVLCLRIFSRSRKAASPTAATSARNPGP